LIDSLLQESLLTKTRMSPKKFKPQSIVSPSPKDLKPRKSSVSRKIIIWGLVASIALVMVACLLDYQQGKLANHTSRLPHEVQVATKYLVDMASEVPHKMEVFYGGAKGQVIILTGKMYIGDKTVAQMLFGVTDEEDPTPKDVKVDFDLEDKIEELIDEGNTLDDLKKVEEVAIKFRKEEELRLYEEKKQQLKEEAMILMEAEKKAAMEALLEEKAKLRAKIEAETAAMKLKEEGKLEDDKNLAEKVKAEIAASAEALKAKLAAQAAAASQMVLEKQKEEMARLSEKLNKKLETSKLEAEEVKETYKDGKKLEPKQQVSEESKKEAEEVKETYKDERKSEPKQQFSEDTKKEAEEVKETNQDDKKSEPKQQVRKGTKEDSSKKVHEEDEAE